MCDKRILNRPLKARAKGLGVGVQGYTIVELNKCRSK